MLSYGSKLTEQYSYSENRYICSSYKPASFLAVWPVKSRQIAIKVAQKWFHLKNNRFWHLYKNLPKNVGGLGKFIVAKDFEKLIKVQ